MAVTRSTTTGRPAQVKRAPFVSAAVALAAALVLFLLWRALGPSGAAPDPTRTNVGGSATTELAEAEVGTGSAVNSERSAVPSMADTSTVTTTPSAASSESTAKRTTSVVVRLANPARDTGPWRVHAERDHSPMHAAPGATRAVPRVASPVDDTAAAVGADTEVASEWLVSAADRATLTLAEGRWIVRASGAEWTSELRRVTADGDTLEVALAVYFDCTVVGRAVDADGAALDGTTFTLRVAANGVGTSAVEAPVQRVATCDDDGHFVFERVPARAFELVPGTSSVAFASPQSFEARAPTTDLGVVVWPPLASLMVEVVDANGAPLAGVRVDVSGHPRGNHTATSDLEGRIVVDGVPSLEGRAHADLAGVGRGNTPFAFDARAPQKVVVRLMSRADDPRRQ